MFCNCLGVFARILDLNEPLVGTGGSKFCHIPHAAGVVTVNLYTMRNEALDIFKPNRWVVYAVLTGVFYAVADIYFLKLSGTR